MVAYWGFVDTKIRDVLGIDSENPVSLRAIEISFFNGEALLIYDDNDITPDITRQLKNYGFKKITIH
jgi:hypothetical protein